MVSTIGWMAVGAVAGLVVVVVADFVVSQFFDRALYEALVPL